MRKMKALACRAMLLCLLLALLIPAAALAIDPIDPQKSANCSLTLDYDANGTPIVGAQFTLYRVADSDEFSDFTFSGAFSGYAYLNVHDYASSQWNDLAEQLAAFVADKGVTEGRFVARTDENGEAVFSGLPQGLYLLLGEKHAQGDKYYTAAPTLVGLPDRNSQDQWVYAHEIEPKPEMTDRPLTSLQVVKIWEDDYDEDGERPASIIVDLKHKGQVVDFVVLSAENGWRCEWTGLEGTTYDWTAVERDVPPNYLMGTERKDTVVKITNTYDEPHQHTHTKLPQTGLPWWPVWALAGAGMFLFFVGWLRRRGYEED